METKVITKLAVEFNAEEISALERAASIIKNLSDVMSKRNFVVEFEDYDDVNCIYDCGDIEVVSGFLSSLAHNNFTIE